MLLPDFPAGPALSFGPGIEPGAIHHSPGILGALSAVAHERVYE